MDIVCNTTDLIKKYHSVHNSVRQNLHHHRKGEINGIEYKLGNMGMLILHKSLDFPDGAWHPGNIEEIAEAISGIREDRDGEFYYLEDDNFDYSEEHLVDIF